MLVSILFPDDWSAIFVPDTPLLEIFIRGSIVYLALFFGLRFILKRESAGLGISDVLVVVLLADAVQNAMADDYRSIPDGLLLVATIIGGDWGLSALAYYVPALRRVIRPRPIVLIRDGRLREDVARRELLTVEEIVGMLRSQGIERIVDVEIAYVESNGMLTALPINHGGRRKQGRRLPAR